MKWAKTLGVSVTGVLALVAALTIGVSSGSAILINQQTYPLYAGQTTLVGHVIVTQTGAGTLQVQYQMDTGWCLTETHVAAGTIPETKTGNPVPGKFPQGETFSNCVASAGPYTFSGLTTGPVRIAAHAVVWDEASLTTTTVVSRPGVTVNGTGSAVASTEPGVGVSYPNCPAGDNDAIASLWDQNAKFANGVLPTWGGADWIWTTPYPLTPVAGEVATFSDGFTLPAGFQLGGTLTITADNAYSAQLNGAAVGHSISFGPGFPGTLREDAQAPGWQVASQGWQLVNQFSLSGLHAGANTLSVTAANEYMQTDDSYVNWNYGTQAYTNPAQVLTDSNGLDRCINPAGLIYNLTAGTYTQSETAWGATALGQSQFPGANWATYFTFTLQ